MKSTSIRLKICTLITAIDMSTIVTDREDSNDTAGFLRPQKTRFFKISLNELHKSSPRQSRGLDL